mmetsp:Transcript_21352/g.60923  ORF Transcript_21352/g.60923 Transcript_21352/m.60923 type:complete len:243 (-) Transcript_21352:1004-1732(-)
MHLREGGLDAALDPEHVTEGVFVAMLDLKAAPSRPIGLLPERIAELRGVDIDGPGSVDLAEHRLHLRVPHTSVLHPLLWQALDRLVVDLPGPRLSEELSRLADEDAIHVVHVRFLDGLRSAVVDRKRVPREAVLLLKPSVEHVQAPSEFRRHLLDGLLEQVPRTFQLAPAVAGNETREVCQPDVIDMRPVEHLDAALVHLEGVLEILPFLEELGIREDQRRRGHLHVEASIIGGSSGRRRAE